MKKLLFRFRFFWLTVFACKPNKEDLKHAIFFLENKTMWV